MREWNNYFMEIATLVASRSTCDRANVGAVIVNKDNRIVSTGYNGSISGMAHCNEEGHILRDGHCIATIHAEQNAIYYAAKEGIALKGCKLYVTHFPCMYCVKAIIQSGITEVYFKYKYRVDKYAVELLLDNNIKFREV